MNNIGIVGGVGPHAGIDLHLKIINNTIASCDQDHVPVYHISNSHAIMDRTVYLRNTSTENPAYAIINIINMLHSLDCKVIGIPCNTAHAPSIMNVIQEAITYQHKNTIAVVHMIEAVAQHIIQQMHQGACENRVGLLATLGTYQAETYEHILKRYDIELIVPEKLTHLEQVHDAIYNTSYGIKAISNPVCKEAKIILQESAKAMIHRGASAIIMGCTEIPLALQQDSISVPLIDATEILARYLIKSSNPSKLKPAIITK